jgi:hypothetical protein
LKSTLYFFAFFALFAIGLPHYGRYMSLIFQLASCLTFGVHYTTWAGKTSPLTRDTPSNLALKSPWMQSRGCRHSVPAAA